MKHALTILMLAAMPVGAQTSLTLPQALRRAAQNSAQADLAKLSLDAAKEDAVKVRATWFPEIHFLGGHVNLDHEPALKSDAMHLGPFTVPPMELAIADQQSWRAKVTAQYLVYDFGRRRSAGHAAQAKVEAVAAAGEDAVRHAQADTAARFFSMVQIEEQKRVVALRREALRSHLKNVQALFEQGVVARNDLLRTEVALRTVEDADAALDVAKRSSQEAMNIAMGLAPTAENHAVAVPGELPDLPWEESVIRVRATQHNDQVKAMEAKVRALEAHATFQKTDRLPTIVTELSSAYEQNSHMVHARSNALFVGLSWKVFDGGARTAKIQQASAETSSARRELLEAKRHAERAVAALHQDMLLAKREMETARANVKAAKENLRIVEDQYKEGLARTTDALDAEAVLAESRQALVQKRARAFERQASLLAVLGEDLAAFYETHASTQTPEQEQ